MVSFKQAAEIVLKEAKKPLDIAVITSRALEKHILETKGKTPDRTMLSEIWRDVRSKKDKSGFLKVGKATYTLNPKFFIK